MWPSGILLPQPSLMRVWVQVLHFLNHWFLRDLMVRNTIHLLIVIYANSFITFSESILLNIYNGKYCIFPLLTIEFISIPLLIYKTEQSRCPPMHWKFENIQIVPYHLIFCQIQTRLTLTVNSCQFKNFSSSPNILKKKIIQRSFTIHG